jgi:hypothetical protein
MKDSEQKKIVSQIMLNLSLPDDRAEITYGLIENQIADALRDYKEVLPHEVMETLVATLKTEAIGGGKSKYA